MAQLSTLGGHYHEEVRVIWRDREGNVVEDSTLDFCLASALDLRSLELYVESQKRSALNNPHGMSLTLSQRQRLWINLAVAWFGEESIYRSEEEEDEE